MLIRYKISDFFSSLLGNSLFAKGSQFPVTGLSGVGREY